MEEPRYFDSAYPRSMSQSKEGSYVERTDSESLASALLQNIYDKERELEDWQNIAIQLEKRLRDIGFHLCHHGIDSSANDGSRAII